MRNRSGSRRRARMPALRRATPGRSCLRGGRRGIRRARWCSAVDPRTSPSGIGGWEGRAASQGRSAAARRRHRRRHAFTFDGRARSRHPLTDPAGWTVASHAGPDDDRFRSDAFEALQSAPYVDRRRLGSHGFPAAGSRTVRAAGADIISDATPAGSVQVPGSGQPILLMADRARRPAAIRELRR